ncbi:MAG: cation-transporting P-type ATPase [Actinobacteria bacterium]|nr:cation-transporting P-type ATPase [Actinomycetota bacterium]
MNYYELDKEQLFKELKVGPNGLSEEEAGKRLEIYGHLQNQEYFIFSPQALPIIISELKEKKKRSLILRFLDNFIHVLAIILWVAAFLCFIPRVDMPQLGYAIILVIVINAVFSFLQEYRAEKALEALKKMLPSYSKVLRGACISDIC